MKTVRQQVLEYLEAHRAVTAEEIARAFKMTGANARHHLSILMEEGAVEISSLIQNGRRGRPRQRYSPTQQRQRHHFDHLAAALLAEIKVGDAVHEQAEWLERLACRLWAQAEPTEGKASSTSPVNAARENLARRLAQVIRRLNRMNYEARWEAHAQSPRIIFNHCPYAAIVADHPELCQMDALLLQQALEAPVSQQIKLGSDERGLPYCQFILRGKN